MSGPVPTLGYRSKSQAALALREKGLSHAEIAAKVGCDVDTVGALVASARRSRRPDMRGRTAEVRTMLSAETLAALGLAASVRSTSIALIAARLLTHTARDNLIDAILDDGGKP